MEQDVVPIWSIVNTKNCPDWIIELEEKFRTLIAMHIAY